MATYLQLCKRVREACGFAGSGPTHTTGQTGQNLEIVNSVLNADVETQSRWPNYNFMLISATFSTVAGQSSYTSTTTGWPANLSRWDLDHMAINPGQVNGFLLTPMDYRDYLQSGQFKIYKNSIPSVIIDAPGKLILLPPPDGVYSIVASYFRQPVEMTSDTSVSIIPVQYHSLIAFTAIKELAIRYENPVLMQYAVDRMTFWQDKLDSDQLPGAVYNDGFSEIGEFAVRAV